MVAREIPNLKVSGSIPLLLNFLDFFVRLMMFILQYTLHIYEECVRIYKRINDLECVLSSANKLTKVILK